MTMLKDIDIGLLYILTFLGGTLLSLLFFYVAARIQIDISYRRQKTEKGQTPIIE